MSWKGLLSLLIILVILGMLISNEGVQKWLGWLKEAVKKVPGIVPPTQPERAAFPVLVTAAHEYFWGLDYGVANSSFSLRGACEQVDLSGIAVKRNETCTIVGMGCVGDFGTRSQGATWLSLSCDRVLIDQLANEDVMLVATVMAEEFQISEVTQASITFSSLSGELSGSVNQTEFSVRLTDRPLEIEGFRGVLRLVDGTVTLQGEVVGVRSETFSFG